MDEGEYRQENWHFSAPVAIQEDFEIPKISRPLNFESTSSPQGGDAPCGSFGIHTTTKFHEALDSVVENLLMNQISRVYIFYSSDTDKLNSKYPSLIMWKRESETLLCLVGNVSSTFQGRLLACGARFETLSCKCYTTKGDRTMKTTRGDAVIEHEVDMEVGRFVLIKERLSLQLAVSCLAELICNPICLLKDRLTAATIVANGPFSHAGPSSLRLSFFDTESKSSSRYFKRRLQWIRVEGYIFSKKMLKIINEVFMTLSSCGCSVDDDNVPKRETVAVSYGISMRNSLEVFDNAVDDDKRSSRIPYVTSSNENKSIYDYEWMKSPFLLTSSSYFAESKVSRFHIDSSKDKNERIGEKVSIKFLPLHRCANLNFFGDIEKFEKKNHHNLDYIVHYTTDDILEVIVHFSCDNKSDDILSATKYPKQYLGSKHDIICDIFFKQYSIEKIS